MPEHHAVVAPHNVRRRRRDAGSRGGGGAVGVDAGAGTAGALWGPGGGPAGPPVAAAQAGGGRPGSPPSAPTAALWPTLTHTGPPPPAPPASGKRRGSGAFRRGPSVSLIYLLQYWAFWGIRLDRAIRGVGSASLKTPAVREERKGCIVGKKLMRCTADVHSGGSSVSGTDPDTKSRGGGMSGAKSVVVGGWC